MLRHNTRRHTVTSFLVQQRILQPFLPVSVSHLRDWNELVALSTRCLHVSSSSSSSSSSTKSSSSSSSSSSPSTTTIPEGLRRIRNIGIAAHIDAGKTTATERMLMYSGVISKCGEVHDGDTITDFLPQERDRGITIKAAAITFGWNASNSSSGISSTQSSSSSLLLSSSSLASKSANKTPPLSSSSSSSTTTMINLIDTPGHVDFTVEVERSFRVLDGAVLLYDAVNGVEPQSETVWAQARRYGVSRIAFANKMDREGASYEMTASTMKKRLGATPLLLHVPLGESGSFAGVVDVVNMNVIAYEDKEGKQIWNRDLLSLWKQGGEGSSSSSSGSSGSSNREAKLHIPGRSDGNGPLQISAVDTLEAAHKARETLLETLANYDDEIADAYLTASEALLLSSSSPSSMGSSSSGNTSCKFETLFGFASLQAKGLTPVDVQRAIRRIVCKAPMLESSASSSSMFSTPVPLLCGSAYKYKGVQSVLDAVVAYLPSPVDRPPVTAHLLVVKKAVSTTTSSSGGGKGGGGGGASKQNSNNSKATATSSSSTPSSSSQQQQQPGIAELDGTITSSFSSSSSSSSMFTSSSSTHILGSQIAISADPSAPLRALAFKVQNHPSRGPLVFFRVYSGMFAKGSLLLNTSTGERERPGKILQMLADEQREVETIAAGNIGAVTGLRNVKTGDTLCLVGDPAPVLLPRLTLPQPVFSASIEVDGGPTEQKALEDALLVLVREDPSLHTRVDPDTAQTIVSGMGELHLDIAADRLRTEYGVPVSLGKMQVAYRETAGENAAASGGSGSGGSSSGAEGEGEGGGVTGTFIYDKTIGTKRMWAKISLHMELLPPNAERGEEDVSSSPCVFVQAQETIHCRIVGGGGASGGDNEGTTSTSSSSSAHASLKLMPPALQDALRDAIAASFGRGPVLGSPLVGLRVSVNEEETEISVKDTNVASVKAATAKAMEECFKLSSGGGGGGPGGGRLLEPEMAVEVVVPDAYVGDILNDLSAQRRGKIKEVIAGGSSGSGSVNTSSSSSSSSSSSAANANFTKKAILRADVPLKEMVGYSTTLRSKTGGEGSFSMEFARYAAVSPLLQKSIVSNQYM